ncbi:ATP-binding protein [Xylanimonas sp. McL0601]|uniref:ATP-binding protein n=1 Tax=Xylanimonas sp. McL0601 TaxID=3414739 RepID=UPI003CFA9A85
MTMVDTLFGLIPAASTGQQWVARDLQVVNWGGFDGPQRVRLASTATLLAGGSGAGKSTLMDAYIALLMPHTTPFNGASNGGVVGRPRGKDQRNVISYARGKLDESRTADGTRERVLRGDGRDTWTAIAMTWADQSGTELTAVRAWYVPAGATTMDALTPVRATVAGWLDLRDLVPAAEQRFSRPSLTALGLTCFDTDREFAARLYSSLGIGAEGGGDKAVGLLARIQAGQQITTVDALYKSMVLEEPETLVKADDVVEHFDELAGTREQMLTAQAQVRVLGPIRGHRATVDTARDRLAVIDGVGRPDDDTSPVGLWRAERRTVLLRGLEDDVRGRSRAAADRVRELDAAAKAGKAELDAIRHQLWASGGERLHQAEGELSRAEAQLAEVRRQRARLDSALEVLGASVSGKSDFERLAAASQARLAGHKDRHAAFEARDRARDAQVAAERAQKDLTAERDSLAARRGNVPDPLHRARVALAHAAGLAVDDLPFVAELLEVRTEHEQWRDAFDLALGGFATTLLLDAAHLARFRAAIDEVPSAVRLRFEGVPTGLTSQTRPDPSTLPGRLEHARSPFEGWLREHLAERYAFVCVDAAGDLARHAKALTRAGQTSEGSRGAHGGQGRANVLGFTNTRRLSELGRAIDAATDAVRVAAEAFRGAALRLEAVEEQAGAARVVTELAWDAVDVDAAQAACARWADVITQARADNPELDDLRSRAEALDARVGALTEELGLAKGRARELHTRWEQVSADVDAAQGVLDAADDRGDTVSPRQREYLDDVLADAPAPSGDLGDPQAALAAFDAVVARTGERLRHDRDTAATAVDTGCEALRTLFEAFKRQWDDPNLGTDPDQSYADYERILATLETDRLHELAADWRRSLLRMSGDDLTDLERTISRALREITERIDPVNRILAELPFADDHHRLRIDARPVQSALVSRFRKELRDVRELLSAQASDAEREARYARMARLIDRLRPGAPDRADLVDVRRHVRLSAEKVDLEGTHVALYDHIGEKSGGESQELVAFIVGAALRYQLGDAGAERPRYAPVFLDEALIKADAQFSGRAVGAWRGLGFQLVVGAPNDKVSALEPHVDASYVVTKDATGRSRARAVVGLPDDGVAVAAGG